MCASVHSIERTRRLNASTGKYTWVCDAHKYLPELATPSLHGARCVNCLPLIDTAKPRRVSLSTTLIDSWRVRMFGPHSPVGRAGVEDREAELAALRQRNAEMETML
jgi:hypothetical protein